MMLPDKGNPFNSRVASTLGKSKQSSAGFQWNILDWEWCFFFRSAGRKLTGRLQGLSRTTSSSERWTTSIGFDNTGVSCLGNKVRRGKGKLFRVSFLTLSDTEFLRLILLSFPIGFYPVIIWGRNFEKGSRGLFNGLGCFRTIWRGSYNLGWIGPSGDETFKI